MTMRRSWVSSAQAANADFTIHNLPFGVFRDWEGDDAPRVGVAIGDRVLDVSALKASLFTGMSKRAADACAEPTLNALMALGNEYATALRARLIELLDASHVDLETNKKAVQPALVAMSDAEMLLPAQIGDYTDFYASIYHATNVGMMFRPDTPLSAQLQAHSRRLSRARVVHCSVGRARSSDRTGKPKPTTRPHRRSGPPRCSTTNSRWAPSSPAATHSANRSQSKTRARISSACAS